MNEIIHGDCLEVMKTFPDNHFSCVVTDPPYGLKFMGKQWDHGVPGIEFWKEALRICKPGSFLLAFGGTRTSHRLSTSIEDAGFEIRDALAWIYGSGFPKSYNHFGLQGYGTALKPAYEPITMAMKPLDGTFKQNAEKWGQAGINIDGCRLETNPRKTHGTFNKKGSRWPSNVMFDEEAGRMLDERTKGASRFFYCAKISSREKNEGLEGLPLKQTIGGGGTNNTDDDVCGKYGSIKAPSKNHHPTIKPLKLMEYLIKLVMSMNDGLLLDPFAGSGTTIVAAKNLGIDAIGIEKEKEYCEIAECRLNGKEDK